ncbi:hypothetical protein D3C75_1334350 [compost metagenome]
MLFSMGSRNHKAVFIFGDGEQPVHLFRLMRSHAYTFQTAKVEFLTCGFGAHI